MDFLSAVRVFVRVAEAGSFSAVAREMGITQPAVSRQVAALEAHLGARLVQRTTRSVALTEDGRDFLDPARTVLQSVEHAEGAVGLRHGGIAGLVRLSSPVVFGRVLIAPRVHLLLERHPGLSVDLVLDEPSMNLVHDGIDLAIRIGEQAAGNTYVARRIGAFSQLIVGSAAYLAANPAPQHPSDLARHECIIDDRSARREVWALYGPGGCVEAPVVGRFRTDSPEAQREAVLSGLGLAKLSKWLVRRELRDGTLRVVLPDWRSAPVPVQAIYPSRRNLAPRTRAVLDFLLEQFRSDPEISEILGGRSA